MGCIDSGGESPAVRGPDCGPVRGARRRGEFVRLWVCVVTVFRLVLVWFASICKSLGFWFSEFLVFRACRLTKFVTKIATICFDLFFTGLVRVGVKIPQDGNRSNRYQHVATVHAHVWRTVCSVCATGARVARPVPCNS